MTDDRADAMLEVERLVKRYGSFTAVDGISLRVERGEIFGLLGPNGAGKTSTINMLTGLTRITSGTVRLGGFQYPGGVKKAQRIIGVTPDESNLYDDLDGFENLCFCAALYGMRKREREARARELLESFELSDAGKKPFRAYSKGMKRKLTIAAAIIHSPEALFLDEPTTGIDVPSARKIRQLILDLNKSGTMIFLTTHYIEEAERLCGRVAFIVRGNIVRAGGVDDLMREVQQEHVVQLSFGNGSTDMRQSIASALPGAGVEAVSDGVLKLHSASAINLTPVIGIFEKKGIPIYEAKIIRPSLEEVFVRITGVGPESLRVEKGGVGLCSPGSHSGAF
jgi:ABC-2 type transport system ATP-binding protein